MLRRTTRLHNGGFGEAVFSLLGGGGIDTLVSAEGHHLHFLEVKLSYQK
jgi:hypothetical protein